MNNYYIVFNLYLNCYFSLPFPFYGQNVIEKFKSLDSSFFIKFIYFIFGCARSFLLVVESGPYSVIVVCGLLIPAASLIVEHGRSGTRASVVAACGLSSCSSQILEHGLNSCGTQASLLCRRRGLYGSEIKPVSPTLADRFFTTEPPGKPNYSSYLAK